MKYYDEGLENFFLALVSKSIYTHRHFVKLAPRLDLLILYEIYVLFINWCDMSLITHIFEVERYRLEYMHSCFFEIYFDCDCICMVYFLL